MATTATAAVAAPPTSTTTTTTTLYDDNRNDDDGGEGKRRGNDKRDSLERNSPLPPPLLIHRRARAQFEARDTTATLYERSLPCMRAHCFSSCVWTQHASQNLSRDRRAYARFFGRLACQRARTLLPTALSPPSSSSSLSVVVADGARARAYTRNQRQARSSERESSRRVDRSRRRRHRRHRCLYRHGGRCCRCCRSLFAHTSTVLTRVSVRAPRRLQQRR